jgi:hypothetical protein
METCETYGIIDFGKGPIEITCSEIGEHTCHNFVLPEEEVMVFPVKRSNVFDEHMKEFKN